MPSSPFLLALGSALCLFVYDFNKKKAVGALSVPWVLFLSSLTGTILLSLFLWISTLGEVHGRPFPLSFAHSVGELSAKDQLWIFGKALLVASSWFFTYSALPQLPLSLASPLRATAPLFTLLGSMVCYGERPSWLHFGGIACILIATVALLSRKDSGSESVQVGPLLRLGIGTLLASLSGLYDALLLKHRAPPFSPFAVLFWVNIDQTFLFLLILISRSEKRPRRVPASVPLLAVFLLLADALYFSALARADSMLSLVSITRRSSVVLTVLLGGKLLKEQDLGLRFKATLGLLLGWILLSR